MDTGVLAIWAHENKNSKAVNTDTFLIMVSPPLRTEVNNTFKRIIK